MAIAYAKIFPPIGIARVGDSETDWFLGPESPNPKDARPEHFRDAEGRLKRQAARFRIFAFDEEDRVVREITSREADIEWTVALANKKAAWFPFVSGTAALDWFNATIGKPAEEIFGAPKKLGLPAPRNPSVGMSNHQQGQLGWSPNDRQRLEIGGRASIRGADRDLDIGSFSTLSGHFDGSEVFLGQIGSDASGRLIALGGLGKSKATGLNGADTWIRHYANNDGWHDDVSDGPVTATVRLHEGDEIEVRQGAWVIVAPPDFAPETVNLVTAYDVIDEVSDHYKIARPRELPPRNIEHVEFWRDVYPIIRRLDGYSWVSDIGLRGHGYSKPGAMTGDGLAKLADPDDEEGTAARRTIGQIVRKPIAWYPEDKPSAKEERIALEQANHRYMPPLSGDEGDTTDGHPKTWLTVTPRQYAILQAWASGEFVEGRKESDEEPERHGAEPTPFELTQAALEACTGGAFYPGIEITSIAKSPRLYSEAFRINHAEMSAGDITKWMACPWQADFWECQMHWWPAQRPDGVVRQADFDATLSNFPLEREDDKLPAVLFPRSDWARGLGTARPALDGLLAALTSAPQPAEITDALIADVRIDDFEGALFYRIRRIWGRQIFPSPNFPTRQRRSGEKPEFGERIPSPWRLQFLIQEAIDTYSGRYFAFEVPRFEDTPIRSAPKPSEWDRFRREDPNKASGLLTEYRGHVLDALISRIKELLGQATAHISPEECQRLLKLTSPADDDLSDELLAGLAFAELLQATADAWYLYKTDKAGDMDMVQYWARHGVVVSRATSEEATEPVAFVETERGRYDGLSYGDYFHILQNTDDFPDALDLASSLADRVLTRAGELIEDTKGAGQLFVETAFAYTPELFDAKMEEVYEYYRVLNQSYRPWEDDVTRAEQITRIRKLAPFNQLDGAWLRFIADAGEADPIHGLLFQIWRDEVGNGNPAEHHGNLYTSLLRSLGYALPDTASKEYVDQYEFPDSYFVSPAFELAVSAHSKKYLPELLGMTLFLEWEVLELAPGVRKWDYLGIDSKFLRMHVGIDNAVDGHGAKAKEAVKQYLEQISKTAGESVQDQWSRIWRGFVAFAAPMDNYLPDEDTVLGRRSKNVQERLIEMINHKRPYANRNHGQKKLGAERLNDLFEYPGELLESLAASQWVVPGDPDQSRLLTYLTTYDGPMYKVFDDAEIALWAEWITWLGKTGGTARSKRSLGKGDAMLHLLELLRNSALGSSGHDRLKVGGRKISDWFGEPDLRRFMKALREDESGWVVSGSAEMSSLVVDQLRADHPMGRALDRRWQELGGRIGRLVIVEWINAGCPIPGEDKVVKKAPRRRDPGTLKPKRQTLVQALGQGSVH
jgi:hypothetical protein